MFPPELVGVESFFDPIGVAGPANTMIGPPSPFSFPVDMVNHPVTSGNTTTDGGSTTNGIYETTVNPDGSVLTVNDTETVSFSTVAVVTYTPPSDPMQAIGTSTCTLTEKVNTSWSNFDTLTMPDGTGYVAFSEVHSVLTWKSFGQSSPTSISGNYQEGNAGGGSFNIYQTGVDDTLAGVDIDVTNLGLLHFSDNGYAAWNTGLNGTLNNGAVTQMETAFDIRGDNYTHQTDDPLDTTGLAGPGSFQLGLDTLTVNGNDSAGYSSGSNFASDANGNTLLDSGWTLNIGSGKDQYTESDTLDDLTVTPAAIDASDDDPSDEFPVTHVDHDDTETTGNDSYSLYAQHNYQLLGDGTLATADNHVDRDSGQSEAITNNRGFDDMSSIDSNGDSTLAYDLFQFNDDDIQTYGDSDVQTQTLSNPVTAPSSSGIPVRAGAPTTTNGHDDFQTADSDNDKFSDNDFAIVNTDSVDSNGVVSSATLTDQEGDKGTDGESDYFEDDETLPTATAPESDHDTFNEKASVNDTFNENFRVDVDVDSPKEAADQLHAKSTVEFQDTSTAQDGESDKGTEDIADPDPSGNGGSDVEQDKFTDNSDVTDKLNLSAGLQSDEVDTASDGTVTENDAEGGIQDNTQDEERDALVDKHTNGAIGDDVTFDDMETDSETDSGGDDSSVQTYGPVANGTQSNESSTGDQYTETDGDTTDDNGEQVTGPPASDGSLGELISEHDTETDTSNDEITGDAYQGDGADSTLTDPSTGVVTTTETDDFTLDNFDDETADSDVDKHSSGTGSTSDTDNFTGFFQTSDVLKTSSDIDLSIVGSPQAGLTENISNVINVNGSNGDSYSETDVGQAADQSSADSSTGTDEETDDIDTSDGGYEKIDLNDNTTTTSVDPSSGLTTTDTQTNGGHITEGSGDNNEEQDDYTLGEPTDPPDDGEDDITDDDGIDESINGTLTSTDTTSVNGTLPDRTSINSTETVSDKVTASAYTEDDKQGTGTELSTTDGQDTSESSRSTDKTYDDAQVTDTETDSVQSTVSATDPTTGLAMTLSLQDSSGDTTTDSDNGDGTEDSTSDSGPITPGVAPTDTITETMSGQDGATEVDTVFDHATLTATVQGADSQGDQVNVRETVTLDDSQVDDESDDTSEAADGTSTEVTTGQSVANVQISDFLKGSIIDVDPMTGVISATNYTDLTATTGNDTEDGSDPAANGASSDSSTDEDDNGSETTVSMTHEVVTQTNPDGSSAGTPVTTDTNDSDTQSWVDGVTTDEGDTSPAAATSGGTAPAVGGVIAAGSTTTQSSTMGGDAVLITGTGFSSDAQVSFGGVAAQSVVVENSNTIVAVTPAHVAGSADTTVTNGAGTSATSLADAVTFADRAGGGPPGNGSAPPASGSSPSNNGDEVIREIAGQAIVPLTRADLAKKSKILQLAVDKEGYYANSTIKYLGAGIYLIRRSDGGTDTVTGPQPQAEQQSIVRANVQRMETIMVIDQAFPDIPESVVVRAQGVSELAGAALSVPVIAGLAVAPEPTSKAGAFFLGGYAADHGYNGAYMIIWGTPRDTVTTQKIAGALETLGGVEHNQALGYARLGDGTIGLVLNVGGAYKIVRMQAGAKALVAEQSLIDASSSKPTLAFKPGQGGGAARPTISVDTAKVAAERNGIDMRMIELQYEPGRFFGSTGHLGGKVVSAPNGKFLVTLYDFGLRSEADAVNTIAHELKHIRDFLRTGSMLDEDAALLSGDLAELFFQ